jgi:hypothetical protein
MFAPAYAKVRSAIAKKVGLGRKIDHLPGDHDDWANAAAGALVLVQAAGLLEVGDHVLAFLSLPSGRTLGSADR